MEWKPLFLMDEYTIKWMVHLGLTGLARRIFFCIVLSIATKNEHPIGTEKFIMCLRRINGVKWNTILFIVA